MDLTSLTRTQSTRTNFLAVGVRLCALIAAICAAPLAFVSVWIAVWLMVLMSILVLGTFGIWAYHAVKNSHLLNTEEHTEKMAAISLMGQNRDGLPPLVIEIEQDVLIQNPLLTASQGDGGEA